VIGSLIALCCIGGVVMAVAGGAGGSDTSTNGATTNDTPAADSSAINQPSSKAAAPRKAKAGIGTPVRDGKFEFVVKSQKCGVGRVGSSLLGQDAQGQFCLVVVTVKNIGDAAQLFDASSQKGFNAAGQEYSADGGAGIYANDQAQTFLNEINPGNQVQGTLVFDIPKGAAITRLELHDSPFSGGVEVSLT